MRLDIVIPSLNESKNLKNLLPYLKSHKMNAEVGIIVVGAKGTTDDSAEICRSAAIRYLKAKKSCRAHQMNLGASASDADILMFLHADVFPPQDFVQLIHEALRSHDYGIFSYRFDSDSFLLRLNSLATRHKSMFSGGGDQCLFITRALFDAKGGFSEEQIFMEDFELFSRLKAHGSYALIPSPSKVSPRKYQHNSWLRVNLVNLLAMTRFYMGSSPVALKEFCSRWLR